MKILITGSAGFIGFYVMKRLAMLGNDVLGIDNINDYYDVRMKYARLSECGFNAGECEKWNNETKSATLANCSFIRTDIADKDSLESIFKSFAPEVVVSLAAQAGVRHSITNPYDYLHSNLVGFLNILECCRNNHVRRLVYASSSSVYGLDDHQSFRETDAADTPVSLYAATKKSDELMAHSYSKLYGIETIGLRYFTVYGPWGRPDMAPMLFANAISSGQPIKVFNNGQMQRDFTFIDDIAAATVDLALGKAKIDETIDGRPTGIPYNIYNVGCGHPEKLLDFISLLEENLGRKAQMIMMPMQPGDVVRTWSDTSRLTLDLGFSPKVDLKEGIKKFISWYKSEKNPLR